MYSLKPTLYWYRSAYCELMARILIESGYVFILIEHSPFHYSRRIMMEVLQNIVILMTAVNPATHPD